MLLYDSVEGQIVNMDLVHLVTIVPMPEGLKEGEKPGRYEVVAWTGQDSAVLWSAHNRALADELVRVLTDKWREGRAVVLSRALLASANERMARAQEATHA
jgi:folylpolyglutamate synthase/dihydropteroate synthase